MAGQLGPAVGATLPSLASRPTMMWPRRRRRRRAEARVLDRGGADDDVADAVVQVALDGVEVADAAAELDRDVVADVGIAMPPVLGLPAKAPFRSTRCRASRAGLDPVAPMAPDPLKRPCAWSISPVEANALTVLEVDGGMSSIPGSAVEERENRGSGLPADEIGQQAQGGSTSDGTEPRRY